MGTFDPWNLPKWRDYQNAMVILKSCRDAIPAHPCRAWTEHKLGFVYEICCPNCETVFEWTGKFYAPRCPACQLWLSERNAASERKGEGTPTTTSSGQNSVAR